MLVLTRLPRGNGGSVHAISNTGHNAADNEMRQGVCACLQGRTDDHDYRAGENGLAATKVVSNPDTEDSTEETAQVIRGSGNS